MIASPPLFTMLTSDLSDLKHLWLIDWIIILWYGSFLYFNIFFVGFLWYCLFWHWRENSFGWFHTFTYLFDLLFLIWSLIWPSSFSSFFNVLVYRPVGSEFSEDNFVAKIKMEIVVSKDQVWRVKKWYFLFELETELFFPSMKLCGTFLLVKWENVMVYFVTIILLVNTWILSSLRLKQ